MNGNFFFEKIAQLDWDKLQELLKFDTEMMEKFSNSFSVAYREHTFWTRKGWTEPPKPVDWLGNIEYIKISKLNNLIS